MRRLKLDQEKRNNKNQKNTGKIINIELIAVMVSHSYLLGNIYQEVSNFVV